MSFVEGVVCENAQTPLPLAEMGGKATEALPKSLGRSKVQHF